MDEIGDLLPVVFGKLDPPVGATSSRNPDSAVAAAGQNMARHSLPIAFESGVLTLATDCATWGAQLRQMTEEIRAQVNRFLGLAVVKRLVVKRASQPELFYARESAEKAVVRHLPAGRSVDTTSIVDPKVAQAIAGHTPSTLRGRGGEPSCP